MKKINLRSAFIPIIFFGLGILVTVLFIVIYTFVTKPSIINTLGKWEEPVSNKRGYPIVDEKTNELLIYDLDDKKLKKTGVQGSDPFPSPDLSYTAYIDYKDTGLKLLSNASLKSINLDDNNVALISGWYPDSSKLIYSKRDGEVVAGTPRLYTWLYDVKQNDKIKITEGQPVQWVDDNNIIVSRQIVDDGKITETLYLVNLRSKEAVKIN